MNSFYVFVLLCYIGIAYSATPQQCRATANLMISQYIEGGSFTKGIQLFNPTNTELDMRYYEIWIQTKCEAKGCLGSTDAENTKTFDGSQVKLRRLDKIAATLRPNTVLTISHPGADNSVLLEDSNALYYEANLFNGDDPFALACGPLLPDGKGIDVDQAIIIDRVGDEGVDEENGFTVCGVPAATKDHTLVRKESVRKPNKNWKDSAGTSPDDCEWYVYEKNTVSKWTFHDVVCPTEKLFISQYVEMESYEKGVEIYNPVGRNIDLRFYDLVIGHQGTGWRARVALSGTLDVRETLTVGNMKADSMGPLKKADLSAHQLNFFNGNEAIGLMCNGKLLDVIGAVNELPEEGWSVAGIPAATKNHVLLRKVYVLKGNTDWVSSAGTTATDSEWIVSDTLVSPAKRDVTVRAEVPVIGREGRRLIAQERQVAKRANDDGVQPGADPYATWNYHVARCYQNTTGELVFHKTDAFFAHYLEADGQDKGYSVYNPSSCASPRSACVGGDIDLDYMGIALLTRDTSKWLTAPRLSLSGNLPASGLVVVSTPNAPADLLAYASVTSAVLNFGNGNEALGLLCAGHLIDSVGVEGNTEAAGWDVAGVPEATANHMLLRKPAVIRGNAGDWFPSAGTTAENSEWIVADGVDDFSCWGKRDCSMSQTAAAGDVVPVTTAVGSDETIAVGVVVGTPLKVDQYGDIVVEVGTKSPPTVVGGGGGVGPFSLGAFIGLLAGILFCCLMLAMAFLFFLRRRKEGPKKTGHVTPVGSRRGPSGSRREMSSRGYRKVGRSRQGTGAGAAAAEYGQVPFTPQAQVSNQQGGIYLAKGGGGARKGRRKGSSASRTGSTAADQVYAAPALTGEPSYGQAGSLYQVPEMDEGSAPTEYTDISVAAGPTSYA